MVHRGSVTPTRPAHLPVASRGVRTVAEPRSTAGPSRNGILTASLVGTSIEWYDYYIFGTAAALAFGPLFFPGVLPGRRHPRGVRHVRGRLPGPPAGRRGDRALRGPDRTQVHADPDAGADRCGDDLIGVLPTYAAIG